MSIRIECSSCGRAYQVSEQLSGKKVRCKHCGEVIPVPGTSHADPSRTHVSRPPTAFKEPAPLDDDPMDSPFDRAGDVDPEQTEIAASTAPRGDLAILEMIIPIVIAAGCIGWLVIRALQNEDPAHSWVGPFRAAVYLLIYGGITFPLALRGATVAGRKLYLPTPDAAKWKALGLFCAPIALGSVLAMTADSLAMFAVGAFFGLIISLGSFIFVFGVQSRHIARGLTIAGSYLVAGTLIGFGALCGVNVLLMAILSVSHAAADYSESPLGPAFSWNPPAADVEHHKSKLRTPSSPDVAEGPDSATTTPSTEPTAQQPGTNITVASTSRPTTAPSAVTQQAKATTIPASQPLAVMTIEQADSHPTVAFSPLLAAAPIKITDDQPLNIFFPAPSSTGTPAFLVLRNRTDFGDELELWTGPNWAKTLSFAAQPKTMSDRGEIVLSSKANVLARMVSMAHLSVQVRPLTGDEAAQEKQTHIVDVELGQNGTPYLLGFTSTGLAAMIWRSPDSVALVDPQSTGGNSIRGRVVSFSGLDSSSNSNVLITPDAHLVISVQRLTSSVNGTLPGNYFVADTLFGDGGQRFALTNLPGDRSIQLTGMHCSSDGKRVALMYLSNGTGLIEVYHLPDATRIKSQIFSGAAAQSVNNYHGSAINWIAGDSALLINGRYVMDSQSVTMVGDLGVENVKGDYVIDRKTLALLISDDQSQGHCSLMLATLNSLKFPGTQNTHSASTTSHGSRNP